MERGYQVPAGVTDAVSRMKSAASDRETSMDRVRKVRRGEFALVWPDKFNDEFPTAIVSNFVDVAARDLAANLSPLPSLACSAGQMHTDADKRRAEKMNRIGANFWRHSRLQTRMKYGADQYLTYGFLPFWVEADYKNKMPLIHVEDPIGAYFDLDRWQQTKRYARVWRQGLEELAAQFPEFESLILTDEHGRQYATPDTEVVRYVDDKWVVLYLPERNNCVVASYEHGLDFCPVHIALRPGVEVDPRGQFDDVLWVQLAHTVMAALTLEAGHKAVQAPLTVPMDVNEIAIGPDAVLQTDMPDKIRRVPLEVPAAAFALGNQLQQEMKEGAGYPETRFGNGPAGGSTGRGISALEGGFDTQIKLGQDILGDALRIVTEMGFKLQAKLFPSAKKKISGTLSGESFEITYVPGKDITDEISCDVSYGFAAGISPNAAIVTLLQLRGDQIIGRDTFRRHLPFDIDIDQQQRELDVQMVEDAVMQGLAASLQASGQMFAQGQTQQALTFFTAATQIIEGRRAGKDMSELIQTVFIDPAQAQIDAAQQAAQQQAEAAAAMAGGAGGAPAAGPDGESLEGVGPNGLPLNVAPGQAGMAPGGRPSVQDLTAGFSAGGNPNLQATVRRRIATG